MKSDTGEMSDNSDTKGKMQNHLIPIYDDQTVVEFAEKQLGVFWLADEIKVEKDVQDVLTNFSPAEKHAVVEILRLFALYETHVGDEWWSGRFKRMFDSADWHRMASVFSMFELAVHAVFYQKINELLYVNTEDFYRETEKDAELRQRIDHINSIINSADDKVALGGFCMVEGVVLYSQFAFLRHYQSQGKNKLLNVNRGIVFSVRDEAIHSLATAYAFKVKMQNATEEEKQSVEQQVKRIAELIYEHECVLISRLFSKGKIEGITAHQLEEFTKSRINTCFRDMGLQKVYDVPYDPISSWFYKGINDYQFNDFFSGQGREYNRNWSEDSFNWITQQ